MKKLVITISFLLLLNILTACDNNPEDFEMIINGTETLSGDMLWKLRDDRVTTNLKLNNTNTLILEEPSSIAVYQSISIETTNFIELVMSWNLKNLGDAELVYYIALGDGEKFGDFQIMGQFSDARKSSISSYDAFASVSYDIVTNKDVEKNTFIKLRVSISPNNANQLILENISLTTKVNNDVILFDENNLINKRLNVNPLQQLSVPDIGSVICSPTSLAMVVNYYGFDFTQTEMAKKVLDRNGNIYGNWTFNASFAGSLEGLYGRVEYIDDFSKIVAYIKNDIPVVMSINSTSKDQLTGSIMAYPAGHLIVLIGFEKIEGIWYGIVNDPAEYENSKVERKYPVSQLIDVWRQYTYIITDESLT